MAGPVDGAAIFEDVAESHIAVAAQHIQAKSVLDTHFGMSLCFRLASFLDQFTLQGFAPQ